MIRDEDVFILAMTIHTDGQLVPHLMGSGLYSDRERAMADAQQIVSEWITHETLIWQEALSSWVATAHKGDMRLFFKIGHHQLLDRCNDGFGTFFASPFRRRLNDLGNAKIGDPYEKTPSVDQGA